MIVRWCQKDSAWCLHSTSYRAFRCASGIILGDGRTVGVVPGMESGRYVFWCFGKCNSQGSDRDSTALTQKIPIRLNAEAGETGNYPQTNLYRPDSYLPLKVRGMVEEQLAFTPSKSPCFSAQRQLSPQPPVRRLAGQLVSRSAFPEIGWPNLSEHNLICARHHESIATPNRQ